MFSQASGNARVIDPPYFVKREHEYVIDANDEGFHRELLKLCCKPSA